MPTVEELQERAVKLFCTRPSNFPTGRPFNCCESVMSALKDYLGVETDLIPKIGTGIGAGVSLNGLPCGSRAPKKNLYYSYNYHIDIIQELHQKR